MYLLILRGARRRFYFLSLVVDFSFESSGLLLLLVKIFDLYVFLFKSKSLNPP